MSIVSNIIEAFKGEQFNLKKAYEVNPGVNKDSVRARIYENLGVAFNRVGRGLYMTKDESVLLIEGNGRDLSAIEDGSVQLILDDHPWQDPESTKGRNRNFADYDTFQYTKEDFMEKARVLEGGAFLCEVIPAESATNYEYLFQIKQWAKECGFKYYAKVPWKKGTFVSNTGRTAKNTEDIMIFSKGKARALRPDKQRGLDDNGNPTKFMSGAAGMLPTCFDVQPVSKKEQIAQSEKPVELYMQIIELLTKPGELIIDQFAGSGVTGEAAIKTNRKAILVELCKEKVEKIAKRLAKVKELIEYSTPAPTIVSVA